MVWGDITPQRNLTIFERIYIVADKSSKQSSDPFDGYSFINWSLNREQKDECDKWLETTPQSTVLDLLEDQILSGYKLSVSYGSNDVSYATFTDKNATIDYAKKVLSVRAKEPLEALGRLTWLHSIFSGGNWDNLHEETYADEW